MNISLQSLEARHPAALSGAPAALRALNLQFSPGEQVAIIGPSGAGKTTLLQVLACALPPNQGQLQLAGVNPWTLPARALRRLRCQLFPSDIPAAYAALVHFDLGDKLFERVDRLSGGERQRVGLARALLAPASLWLIDEPLSALDPMRARMAMSALVCMARERQVTLVATLHQVDMALAHFPRIIGLRDGQLMFDLPSAQVSPERLSHLYDQYEHELRGEALSVALQEVAPATPAPVVMHCR